MKRKRVTAARVSIADIVNSTYQGGDQPHALTNEGLYLSRVSFVGFASDEPFQKEGYASITMNDGTSNVKVKAWKTDARLLDGIVQGALLMVVGKIKEYEGQIYVVPEIVHKIDNPHYMELHLLQRYYTILRLANTNPEPRSSQVAPSNKSQKQPEKQFSDQILEYIQANTDTAGVSIRDIAEYFKSQGYSTADIHLEVIKLQEEQKIKELQIGIYASFDETRKKPRRWHFTR